MSTVNKVLEQTLSVMQSLNLEKMVCVFDQPLYAKAAEIVWKRENFKNIIIQMGTFHTICNLLSITGKRSHDSGLNDLCVEASVLAESSVAGVMEGWKYNKPVRLHKLVYENRLHLVCKGFLTWMEQNQVGELHNLKEALESVEWY